MLGFSPARVKAVLHFYPFTPLFATIWHLGRKDVRDNVKTCMYVCGLAESRLTLSNPAGELYLPDSLSGHCGILPRLRLCDAAPSRAFAGQPVSDTDTAATGDHCDCPVQESDDASKGHPAAQ